MIKRWRFAALPQQTIQVAGVVRHGGDEFNADEGDVVSFVDVIWVGDAVVEPAPAVIAEPEPEPEPISALEQATTQAAAARAARPGA